MIKNSTYIRSFTDKQKEQLEKVAQEQNLKTVSDILFFALDKYLETKNDVERQQRITEMVKRKVKALEESKAELEQKLDKIKNLLE